MIFLFVEILLQLSSISICNAATLPPSLGPTLAPSLRTANPNQYLVKYTFASTTCTGNPIQVEVTALGLCFGSSITNARIVDHVVYVNTTLFADSSCAKSYTPSSLSRSTFPSTCYQSTQYTVSGAYPMFLNATYYSER